MNSRRDKFVIAEIFSNQDGKTSASAFIGVIVGLLGCIGFLAAIIGYIFKIPETINVMQQCTIFIGAASALLAARKFAPDNKSLANSDYSSSEINSQSDTIIKSDVSNIYNNSNI